MKTLDAETLINKPTSIRKVLVAVDLTEHSAVTGNYAAQIAKCFVAGRTLSELAFDENYGVVVTRLTRAEVEFTARESIALHLGDLLVAVGPAEALEAVGGALGNEPKALDHPPLAPLFSGILGGVILGTIPIYLTGLPAPVRLGLAGGH